MGLRVRDLDGVLRAPEEHRGCQVYDAYLPALPWKSTALVQRGDLHTPPNRSLLAPVGCRNIQAPRLARTHFLLEPSDATQA